MTISIQKNQPVVKELSANIKGRGRHTSLVDDDLLVHVNQNKFYLIVPSLNQVSLDQNLTDAIANSAGVNDLLVTENIWWIATNSGLIKLNRKPKLFSKILNNKSASVRSLIEYGDNKWVVSTYQGLYFLDGEFQIESHVEYPYMVFHQYFQKNGSWLGLEEDRGLMGLDLKGQNFENLWESDDRMQYQCAVPLGEKIYMGSYSGLYLFDRIAKTIHLVKDAETGLTLENVVINDLIRNKNQLWIGASSGFYRFNLETNHLEKFYGVASSNIRDIYEAEDGKLWLGTQDKGLISFDPKTKKVGTYDHNAGLSNNTVNCVTSSHFGKHIWVGTNNGLSRIDLDKNVISNYYEEDGIAHNEFNRKAISHDKDGNILMGGLNGITIFNPNEFVNGDKKLPKLLLTGAGKYDGETNKIIFRETEVTTQRSFQYDSNDRLFRFRFALTDFENSDQNQFRYQITGLDENWVDLSNQRELLIDNLSPGEYTLLISGTHGKGSWSDPLLMTLHVDYAYYQRWWFYVLILTGFILTGIAIHKVRVARLVHIERVRARIARDLHDELGSTLTRISMFSELAGEDKKNKEHFENVAQMSREASSTLSDIVWSIDNTDDTIGALLDRIKDHLHLMVQPTEMESRFSVKNLDEESKLKAEVKQNLFLIAKEAINNSVKYSNGSLISVDFSMINNQLEMKLADNGKINNPKGPLIGKGGNGLRNMESKAKSMNGSFELSKENGFSIYLSVPV